MTIGTSNVSFSSIASEIGKSQTNLSLRDAAQDTMILNPSNSRQTYTLTDTITLTTQDSSVADNMNLAGSNNFEVSEFKSYDKVDKIVFSSTSSSPVEHNETIIYDGGVQTTASCIGIVRGSAEIYCKRVGSDLVWFVGEGGAASGPGGSRKEGTSFNGTDTEAARLAGVGSSTTVSVTYSSAHTITGFIDGVPAAFSSGSTNSNLASTNTKIGFDFRLDTTNETFSSQHTIVFVYHVDFTVTVPGYDARVFRFSAAPMKGRFTTNSNGNEQC
tara:strand:+ start:346 stop:1164 length:819 start_codon:yes stop_codon:yes gene_type:complete